MKRIIIVLVSGVIYTSLISGNAIAQKTDLSFAASKINFKFDSSASDNALSGTAIDRNKTVSKEDLKANFKEAKANLKISNHFNRNFKNVSNIRWDSQNDIAIAKFTIDGKSAKVVYNKTGKWVYTILSYHEDQMPLDVKSLLKANYSRFKISLIQEISQDDIRCYMIYLDNATSFRHVLIYDDQIISDESFNKGMEP